jgi:hypothetical protein
MAIIEHKPTWDIIDSSKMNTYLDCPRQFFYRYILGWSEDNAKHDLIFGEAWHRAMETLLLYGHSKEAIDLAFIKFLEYYREHFDEMSDDLYTPKAPYNAYEALKVYSKHWERADKEFTVLHTEISGQVAVTKNRTITFRMDALCQHNDSKKYFFLEHKTTKRMGRQWTDQWALAIQVGTYNYALSTMFGPDFTNGGFINGMGFTKAKLEPIRLHVKRSYAALNAWHYTMFAWMERLEDDMRQFDIASDGDQILECFPMNPGACTKYYGCPYHDFCTSWANPLQKCEAPPYGFKEEHWNPMDRETKAAFSPDGKNIIEAALKED